MELELVIVFGIIIAALFLFVTGLIPVDQTAVLVMVSLMVTGILTPEEGVSGFSNSATVTILALLIISQALKNTGVVDELGDQLLKVTGHHLWLSITVVMLIAAVCSAFINTTAVVAVFIPTMFKISEKAKIKVAVLLMPLSFAAMVGGSSTMIGTSTNLLINSMAEANGASPFEIFDLTLFGGVLLIAVVGYMVFIGSRFLNQKQEHVSVFDKEVEAKNYLTEVVVTPDSTLIGSNFDQLKLYDKTEFSLQRLKRKNKWVKPTGAEELQAGDIITIKTNIHEIINLNNSPDLRIVSNPRNKKIEKEVQEEEDRILVEALIVPNSYLIGRKIKDVEFERFYNMLPLAGRRGGLTSDLKMMDHVIEEGDILLLEGKKQMETEDSKHDWIVVQQLSRSELEKEITSRKKMFTSIAILFLVIVLAVSNILPILISAWLGVALLFITGCINIKKAYQNVEWKVIFLLAGIIPLGTALSKTGGDKLIADFIVDFTINASPRTVVSVLFIITTILTGIISNQATAVLLVPIAISIANSLGISSEPLLVAILFGANTSFVTPVGYQTNAMIFGPGNYKFLDFVKVGGLLSLLFWALATWLIPIFYM